MHLLTLGHSSLRLLRMHLRLRLGLPHSHVALSLRLLHSLRAHLLSFVHLRLRMHCRAMLRVGTATSRSEHSRLGRVGIGVTAPPTRKARGSCSRREGDMAAAATPALHRRASREVRVAATAAAAVRASASVPAARTCVGRASNGERRGACEKNEPFHGETPYRSTAKRFANRPVPPFMCMK